MFLGKFSLSRRMANRMDSPSVHNLSHIPHPDLQPNVSFLCLYIAVDVMAETDTFSDGLWHSVTVDIESGGSERIGKINITVDGRSHTSNRQLSFTTTEYYYIGGEPINTLAQGRRQFVIEVIPNVTR